MPLRSSRQWRFGRLPAAFLVAMALDPAGAAAETDVLQLARGTASYVDNYLQNPKVSGNLLVGVRWAGPEEPAAAPLRFDPRNVRLIVPAGLPARSACATIASKDGRYSAENLYVVPPDVVRQPRLDARPKERYESLLGNYDVESMAVMIRATPSCDAAEFGSIIPALLVPRGGDVSSATSVLPRLIVDVNADPVRVSLSLLDIRNTKILDAACGKAGGGVQISFSTVCTFSPATRLPAGKYRLRLATKERFRTVSTDFDISIAD